MRLNFVVKNAKLTQKKIKQILELNGFNTILISKGINNYGLTKNKIFSNGNQAAFAVDDSFIVFKQRNFS